ncbi:polynucleotide adenylyltransferase [Candidatus Thioglobus autotrophicus]|jgi:tRNA nucleotidyltransferase (CCA-adding enzyme)|uniref:Polynucleotide adenylyltransferase n=1 Tax=Candidatus Thioglobus autotrophicus TaxID=1705394 RepID=A0A0M4PNF6_9GAMM|nr:polynucleotide adenylyltransferase [Candidatus Thioglobus autotrophicus]ALE52692.1 polynucleotide adenylyltransferase [Candidatus Thioglobus autotrophicus]WPE16720.1 polynucleotide adenylyltransferase [Candidatus Thioglobus autotrophicus]
MKVYLVGGAVRDRLLNLADDNTEKDWVVVGASPEEMLDLGYRQVGKEFPVFLHPGTQEEYALARLERKVAAGYKGFEFDTSKAVTLEQDLSRRDLTINAMAEKNGELVDPFNGQEDLDKGLLRHVSSAFSEDPVRILRVARFAARFNPAGFKVAHSTHKLMKDMVSSGEVDALTPERVFKELEKSLAYKTPSAFFKVLSACGAYERVFVPLSISAHQNHDNAFELLDTLKTNQSQLKFCVWLIQESVENIDQLCQRLKCPKHYEQLAKLSAQFYQFVQSFTQQTPEEVFEFFAKTDALRRKDRFVDLLAVYQLLSINVDAINRLAEQLATIDIASLDKSNIAQAIANEKRSIIQLFLNSAQ